MSFFFFNDTATTEIYTLSLHDALPISHTFRAACAKPRRTCCCKPMHRAASRPPCCADRKSTRLNSSHLVISYAVFCLKKKKKTDPAVPFNDSTLDHVPTTTLGAPPYAP